MGAVYDRMSLNFALGTKMVIIIIIIVTIINYLQCLLCFFHVIGTLLNILHAFSHLELLIPLCDVEVYDIPLQYLYFKDVVIKEGYLG